MSKNIARNGDFDKDGIKKSQNEITPSIINISWQYEQKTRLNKEESQSLKTSFSKIAQKQGLVGTRMESAHTSC